MIVNVIFKVNAKNVNVFDKFSAIPLYTEASFLACICKSTGALKQMHYSQIVDVKDNIYMFKVKLIEI